MPPPASRILSLFCGAGGLDCGFTREGFKVVLACDNSQAAVDSYNLNVRKRVAQITDLSVVAPSNFLRLVRDSVGSHPLDGVIGGPPCQGFSRGNASAEPDDPRNKLAFRYADLLARLNSKNRIKFFVFENVMGLTYPRHTDRFRAVRDAFVDAGFRIFLCDLDAQDFGVPQFRRRLFIVGLNAKQFPDVDFTFPKGAGKKQTVKDVIYGLPAPAIYYRGIKANQIPYHPNHWTMKPRSAKLIGAGSATDGRSFRKLEWDSVSPTVAYGNREIHIHPDGGRRLSVHEAMLLQGFPPSYKLAGNFSQQVTQVSNAVPPPVAQAIACSIRQLLRTSREL
ncbi:MAG: DNA cytosine methyltransferase [Planctomycetales bacterium]